MEEKKMGLQIGKYILTDYLSNGAFGAVWRAYEKETRKIVAIKIMPIDTVNKNRKKIEREEEFLKKLNHINVIKYIETISAEEYLLFVLEYCNANTLDEFINIYKDKMGCIHPNFIQHVLKQIVEGINYMHDQQCMHRDLKCQNIMVTFKGEEKVPSSFTERDDFITRHKDEQKRMEIKEILISESIMDLDRTNIEKHQFYKNINDNKEFEKISLRSLIKIIDLGFVRSMNEKTPISFCGNFESVSPELFFNKDKTNYKCDLWGIGVVAYNIITQLSLYDSGIDNPNIVNDYQKRSAFNLPEKLITYIEIIDFIDRLILIDPNRRMDWSSIRKHPFLVKNPEKFHIIEIEIKNNYNKKTVDNKGKSLVEVIDIYKQSIKFNNSITEKTLRQLIDHYDVKMIEDLIIPNYFDELYEN